MIVTKKTTVNDILKEAGKSIKYMHDLSDRALVVFLIGHKRYIHIKAMQKLLTYLLAVLKRKDALKLIADLGFIRKSEIAKSLGMSKATFLYNQDKYLKKNIKYGKSVFYEWRKDEHS